MIEPFVLHRLGLESGIAGQMPGKLEVWRLSIRHVIRLSCRDEWQIKGLVVVMMAGGDGVTRFPLCASERATSVGVVPPG